MKQWLAISAIVGLALGAAFSLATRPSSSGEQASAKRTPADTTSHTSSEYDPLARAYFYPDPEGSSDAALIAVCAGSSAGVPGAPEPDALPSDRRQSVAVVAERVADIGLMYSGDQSNMKWVVADDASHPITGWTPSSVRQKAISVAHLGYIACVDQTGVTFKGTCGDRKVVKIGVRVSVREAHGGTEIGGFDVVPANSTGCGPEPVTEYALPDWDEFGARVTELVRR